MHWSLPQDCLQPTSSDLTYQNHLLWLRAAHDPLVFESAMACAELANVEGKKDRAYIAMDSRSMHCPRGAAPVRVDHHSMFGRASFEVQSVDSGWLLEHSSGAPMGYVQAEWEVHCPMRPELDPTLGLDLRLHEIMVRPSLRGHGFGSMMTDKVVEAVSQHIDLLMAAHSRLRGMGWSIHCHAETIGLDGEKAFSRLESRIKTLIKENTQPIHRPQDSFALGL